MQRIFGILTLLLLVTACSNAQEHENESSQTAQTAQTSGAIVTLDNAEEFKKRLNDSEAQLIDVRTPEEFANGKIANATNSNFFDADFANQMGQLDKNKPVLVYCASGGRSAKAVALLKDMGFAEIHELKGGYNAWR